jgi:hypothetical protein
MKGHAMTLKTLIESSFPYIVMLSIVTGCESGQIIENDREAPGDSITLFDATHVIQDNWRHLPIRGKTDYRLVPDDGGVAIRAEGKISASGLIRTVEVNSKICPTLEWRWKVEKLQGMADLKQKQYEDVAASIFLLFGDPGFMASPEPVPTLRYVWTNEKFSQGEIIDNPYLPGVVRSIVIRTGEVGDWFTERRNIFRDYKTAFGSNPKESVHAVALFTDNDQTKEPVVAYYRWANMVCGDG